MKIPASSTSPHEAGTHGLQRRLTGRQVSMIGLGGAIGTGLFLGSGLAISHAGPSTILAYIACGLVALVIAWAALAEMVVVHPAAGAFGVLAHSYIGRWAGFVVRWTYWAIQCTRDFHPSLNTQGPVSMPNGHLDESSAAPQVILLPATVNPHWPPALPAPRR
jgi:amino acid permease